MDVVSGQGLSSGPGLLGIEDFVGPDGAIVVPPGITLPTLIDRNIANVGDSVAYRYLDYSRSDSGQIIDLSWKQLDRRIRAIGARLQQLCTGGERVAVLAPQGLDYVCGFFATLKAGCVAVPLFAP